jgi:hypothetical protein
MKARRSLYRGAALCNTQARRSPYRGVPRRAAL